MQTNTTFNLNEIWPSWKDDITLMFDQGATNIEVCAEILRRRGKQGFTMMTFHNWRQKIEEFRLIIEQGQLSKKAWWFSQGRQNITNNKFNTSLYIRMMGNLFAFRTEVTVDSESAAPAKVDMSKWDTADIEAYVKLVKKAREKEDAAKERAQANVLCGRFGTGTDD